MSATSWLITMKPSFLSEWLSVPAKEAHQIQEKLALLVHDPKPDGKAKKRLVGMDKVCRLRSGDYRIFYVFEHPYVSLLGLRKRDESTYGSKLEAESLGGHAADVDIDALPPGSQRPPPAPSWESWLQPTVPAPKPLPEPITVELLTRLQVPHAHHAPLLKVQTEDDLLACSSVPAPLLDKVLDALFPKSLTEVMGQPNLVAQAVEDLLQFKEGKLLGFLLELNPAQQRFVSWGKDAAGPTLLKGGPGTGKSTVALYRVKTLIESLRKEGKPEPRVLFTTYTNALVKFSEQLLESLLQGDASLCTVRTADSVARQVVTQAGERCDIVEPARLRALLDDVIAATRFEGNKLQQRAQAQTIERLRRDYLLEEIGAVIEARRMATRDDYLAAKRTGRRIALNASQRSAIWQVREGLAHALRDAGVMTWHQLRARAAALVEEGRGLEAFDAVLVDEAQDLDPSLLQMLVGLCKSPNRIFLAADANQSIYGSGFRWTEVHEALRFQGRTGVLHANHRSTREITEAAVDYLSGASTAATLDDVDEREYVHTGPLPVVRAVASAEDEAKLIARFLTGASRGFRLGLGSAAVFCPTERACRQLAQRLSTLGIAAQYMSGRELDLAHPGVKVLTLQSSKGLEFPIVALAGFVDAPYPFVPKGAETDEVEEIVTRERRTMFVGMTRAMRALLVVVPAAEPSELLRGFRPELWNTGGEGAESR